MCSKFHHVVTGARGSAVGFQKRFQFIANRIGDMENLNPIRPIRFTALLDTVQSRHRSGIVCQISAALRAPVKFRLTI